jgi:hypothetical protein
MTCDIDLELGAYVLHALEPEEAEAVAGHLARCEACREEARSLAATADLLALLRPEDVDELDVPDPEEDEPSGTTPSGRRRTTRGRAARAAVGGAALVGATLTAAFVTGVGHPGHDHDPPPSHHVVQAADPATHVHAAVAMTQRTSGTRLRLTLTGAYPHGRCSLVARSRDGRTDTAATWVADTHGAAWVTGTTAFRADQLTEFDVVTGTGRVLVRIPVPQATAGNPS